VLDVWGGLVVGFGGVLAVLGGAGGGLAVTDGVSVAGAGAGATGGFVVVGAATDVCVVVAA
jgi:hypothetical protein